MDKLVEPCRCLGSVTDIPCICNPSKVDRRWLARVLEQNEGPIRTLARSPPLPCSTEMSGAMQGRRISVPANGFPAIEQPGDYCGPLMGYTGDKPAVLFLKPNARDPDAPRRARSIQHVISPPHTFTEEPDGTLTITASIGDLAGPNSESDGWHGYLTKGQWRLA